MVTDKFPGTKPDTTTSIPEDCPLCCDEMLVADELYPLHCPTLTCHYNYCSNCLNALIKSNQDGYSVASDGSKQVRVWLQCPQCRGKYQCATLTSEVVLRAYQQVRYAAHVTPLVAGGDSTLAASALTVKNQFQNSQSIKELRTAFSRVQQYQSEVGRRELLEPLQWEVLSTILPAEHTSSMKSSTGSTISERPWKDPTLFLGLEELMNDSEQEFVTQLLTSGHAEGLAQGALILHSILSMASVRQSTSTTARGSVSNTNNNNQPRTRRAVLDLHKIRSQYPLSKHMPTCVALQVYNPEVTKPKPFLAFEVTESSSPSLKLKSVCGPAGRLGLRRGDVVTHLNGEPISSYTEFLTLFRFVQGQETVMLTVNANEETAVALKERADKMKRALVEM